MLHYHFPFLALSPFLIFIPYFYFCSALTNHHPASEWKQARRVLLGWKNVYFISANFAENTCDYYIVPSYIPRSLSSESDTSPQEEKKIPETKVT